MEKFKACEKEMKTKAFSKEGLTQSAKLDPKQQEKVDTMSWVQSMMDELMVQVETAEAEIETLQGGGKKKKSGGAAERLEGLERLNERRKWHISRLELILRLLDNGSLATEQVASIQDDVKYFVDSNSVCKPLSHTVVSLMWGVRMRSLRSMRASMMTSTSTRRRRSSECRTTRVIVRTLKKQVNQVRQEFVHAWQEGSSLCRLASTNTV